MDGQTKLLGSQLIFSKQFVVCDIEAWSRKRFLNAFSGLLVVQAKVLYLDFMTFFSKVLLVITSLIEIDHVVEPREEVTLLSIHLVLNLVDALRTKGLQK